MNKSIITLFVVLLGISLMVGNAFAAPQLIDIIGKEGVIKSVVAKYGLYSSKNIFHGGDRSYLVVEVVYKKGSAQLSDANANMVFNQSEYEWGKFDKEIIRLPAFKEEYPFDEPMCYSQFKEMHQRYLKAKTIKIEWVSPGKDYTPLIRMDNEDNTLRVLPCRVTIVKTWKKGVPGRR